MKAATTKRVLSLELHVNQQHMKNFRSRDFSAVTDDELDYLEWIADQVAEHGPGWIETMLSPQELANLDTILARIV